MVRPPVDMMVCANIASCNKPAPLLVFLVVNRSWLTLVERIMATCSWLNMVFGINFGSSLNKLIGVPIWVYITVVIGFLEMQNSIKLRVN